MATITRAANAAGCLFALLAISETPARAELFTLAVSGTIDASTVAAIPDDTPFSFELTYNTAAPDLDFELPGSPGLPDPTFGRFINTGSPPALIFFHYKAGSYEVTIDNPADFGEFSNILITFTVVNAIDININAPANFPPLGGAPVSFHADFNAFSTAPVFTSDALPTDTALGLGSFDQSAVTLIPMGGVVTGSTLTSLTLTAGPVTADFDDDGDIDGDDLARWKNGFGAGTTRAQGDADGDADADGSDFLTWQRQLGSAQALSATAAPEPQSMAIILTSAAFCRVAFRKRGATAG